MIFEFDVTEDPATIAQLDVLWEGYGDNDDPMRLYIWSYAQNDWGDGAGQFGEANWMDAGNGNADFVLGGAVTADIADYVSPTGQVTILIYDEEASEDTFHDYAAITVPEPSGWLLTGAGSGLLAMLCRLRARTRHDRQRTAFRIRRAAAQKRIRPRPEV